MTTRAIAVVAAALLAGAASLPARAQSSPADYWQLSDSWRYALGTYGYLPTIGTTARLPNGVTTDVSVDIGDTLRHLKMVFFGVGEVQKGRWGAFTDIIYMDVGASHGKARGFHLGSGALPVGVQADTTVDLKSTIWTLAGSYRVVADPNVTFDVLAGARMLTQRVGVNWQLTGNIGQIPVGDRQGSGTTSVRDWNGIVGAKGRFALSGDRRWYAPYYADVGAGDSQVTWQLLGGVGYAFDWGELSAVWRYLEFRNRSGANIEKLDMNGPQVSVVFRW